MMKKNVILLVTVVLFSGCVSGPPRLTEEEKIEAEKIAIVRSGEQPTGNYTKLETVKVADCSGQGGGYVRITGDESSAIKGLQYKGFALGADALINVSCESVAFINNCWVAEQCEGTAVKWVR